MIFRFGQQGFLKVRKKIILNWQGKVLPNCALWCLYISAQETYLLFCSLWCNVVVVVWCTYNRVKDMDMGFRRSTESPPQLLATSSHDNNYLEEIFSILWLIIFFNYLFQYLFLFSNQNICAVKLHARASNWLLSCLLLYSIDSVRHISDYSYLHCISDIILT